MRAQSSRPARKTVEIAFDPMDRLSASEAAVGVAAERPPTAKIPSNANGAAHPVAALPRQGKRSRAQRLNRHAEAVENDRYGAAQLPELRAELARGRAQIAALEASERQLRAELSRIADGQSAQLGSLERSLAGLGDE